MSVISNEIFRKIKKIEIVTSHLVNTLLAGAYRSAFKGRGMEFEEVREFAMGDELRSIDWNVTARMRHPYVKIFREERELTVNLIVDVSASTRLGSHQRLKSELMAEIGAVLVFSAIKNQDRIGLLLFSDQVEKYLPPQKGLRHVLRVIRELLAYEPKHKGTDINAALSFLAKVQRRSAVCFLISDFLCPQASLKAIKIAAKMHDLIAIDVLDPVEKNFPQLPLTRIKDLETGASILIDSQHPDFQASFLTLVQARQKQWRHDLRKMGVDYIEITTDKPYSVAIRKYFEERRRSK